jgi:hypothetical protein
MRDPIVEEVRANRDAVARACGYDLKKFLAQERAFFEQWKGKKLTEPLHPEWRAPRTAAVAETRTEYRTKKG